MKIFASIVLIIFSVFSSASQAAAIGSIVERELSPAELRSIKFEYQPIFENSEMKIIPAKQLAQLLFFYKNHLQTGIDAKWFELLQNPKLPGQKILQSSLHHFEINNRNYMTFVNFSLDSNFQRMFIIDMTNKNLYGSFIVSHGKNTSNPINEKQARYFSNANKSNKSSLGLYITDSQEYENQRHGYAVRLHGLDTSNDLSFLRYIEIHGAEYVHQDTGVIEPGSLGCFVLDEKISREVISKLIGGSLLYAWINPNLLPPQ